MGTKMTETELKLAELEEKLDVTTRLCDTLASQVDFLLNEVINLKEKLNDAGIIHTF